MMHFSVLSLPKSARLFVSRSCHGFESFGNSHHLERPTVGESQDFGGLLQLHSQMSANHHERRRRGRGKPSFRTTHARAIASELNPYRYLLDSATNRSLTPTLLPLHRPEYCWCRKLTGNSLIPIKSAELQCFTTFYHNLRIGPTSYAVS
ncbi:hypothetical protein BJV74DRAFT_301877 [Russula compacta]|nr:hypothetical protein BJV74DRAFT_301877 [Russula compacta]